MDLSIVIERKEGECRVSVVSGADDFVSTLVSNVVSDIRRSGFSDVVADAVASSLEARLKLVLSGMIGQIPVRKRA